MFRFKPPADAEHRRRLGRRSEELACAFLERQGLRIEKTNVRYPLGEIDIVAWEGHTLCLVEVRSTSSDQWGGPLVTVTDSKRRRILRAAQRYLQTLRALPPEIRFDVVAVRWVTAQEPHIEHIPSAFTADGF